MGRKKKVEGTEELKEKNKNELRLWRYYEVELEILERIYGGLPKSPELIEGFLKGKGVNALDIEDRAAKVVEETDKETIEDGPEGPDIEKSWTCFKVDDVGLYIETRQIKAMLKEATSASEVWKKVFGLKSRVGDQLFPIGQGGKDKTRLYLYRDGEPIQKPDGAEQNPARVSGPQGARSIIKIKDYVEGPVIKFHIRLGGNTIKDKVLRFLFEYGTEIGLGADRACERGKFVINKLEEIDELPE